MRSGSFHQDALRAASDSAHRSVPRESVAPDPSWAALADKIAADALSEPGILTVDWSRVLAGGTMLELVAERLRGRGRLVVPVTGLSGSMPPHPVTPVGIKNILLVASGTAGHDDLPPDRVLRSLMSQPGLRVLVLLVDDADVLSSATWRFLDLLLGLARFGKVRLRLVLFGAPGRWPNPHDLPQLRAALTAARAIEHPSRAEESRTELSGTVLSGAAEGGKARISWPTLAVAGPVLAVLVMLAVFANQTRRAPTGTAARILAAHQPAQILLPNAAATGKVGSGAAAIGVVLARVNVAESGLKPEPQHVAVSNSPHGGVNGFAPVHGLLLVARPGDTLATLYSEIYRGWPPPPFADITAANPAPVRPGALVVFPAPPGGWGKPGARP